MSVNDEDFPVPEPTRISRMGEPNLAPSLGAAQSAQAPAKAPGKRLGWAMFWLSIPGNFFATFMGVYVGAGAPGFFLIPVGLAVLGCVTLAGLWNDRPSLGLAGTLLLASVIAPAMALG